MHMRTRLITLALLLSLVAAAPAAASFKVGIGEQKAKVFDDPTWQSLGLKRVRYLVPWDYAKHRGQRDEVGFFMGRAREHGQDVLVTFTAQRGCYVNGKYAKKKACRAPSVKNYAKAAKAFDKAYPWVKTYSAWNEINHKSQPTFKKPKLAAQYYNALQKGARKGKYRVMAADVLDNGGVSISRYLREMRPHLKGSPKLWGLHNYGDVNYNRSGATRTMLRTVPGEVWMTETGGIVKLLPQLKNNAKRAASRTRTMFKLANKYDTKRKGFRSKITRLFVYTWYGEKSTARFDAGLVNADGSPRPAFNVFKKNIAKHR
jgi:Glycosyl hydrolase catalytic core